VTWEKPDGADADHIEYYKVTYGANGQSSLYDDIFDQSACLSSLMSNSCYMITVVAVGYDGQEGDTATAEETTCESQVEIAFK